MTYKKGYTLREAAERARRVNQQRDTLEQRVKEAEKLVATRTKALEQAHETYAEARLALDRFINKGM